MKYLVCIAGLCFLIAGQLTGSIEQPSWFWLIGFATGIITSIVAILENEA